MPATDIDPSAVVHAEARVGMGCRIGARSVIGPRVVLGAGNIVGEDVMILGNTRIGHANLIETDTRMGAARYELASTDYDCGIEIGDGNEFHQSVTVNRGCPPGPGITRVGSGNVLMAAAHVGPDCSIAESVVIGEDVYLDESVRIDSYVRIGDGTSVRGFLRIGEFAAIDPHLILTKDVPPFVWVAGDPPRPVGVNEGVLRLHGTPPAAVEALGRAVELAFGSERLLEHSVAELRAWDEDAPEFLKFRAFLEGLLP